MNKVLNKIISFCLVIVILFTGTRPGHAQEASFSAAFVPCLLAGVRYYPADPLRLDFIVDAGDTGLAGDALKKESSRLVKYFLATLTTPPADLWVNLSPFEGQRIIPEKFGQTEMGRDLLAQDYILKQLSSSLLDPDTKLGKAFWSKVYARAQQLYGTTDLPADTFHKIWIMPDAADIAVRNGTALIVKSHMKLMLDTDHSAMSYGATSNEPMPTRGHLTLPADSTEQGKVSPGTLPTSQPLNMKASQGNHPTADLTRDALREIILPELEREVNEGKEFIAVRQVYSALILATWLKRKIIRDSAGLTGYVDGNKVAGIDHGEKGAAERIWQEYVAAFKKGTVNLIREEQDPVSGELVPRKYFSGGWDGDCAEKIREVESGAMTMDAEKKFIVSIQTETVAGDRMFDSVAHRRIRSSPHGSLFESIREVAALWYGMDVWERMNRPDALTVNVGLASDEFGPLMPENLVTAFIAAGLKGSVIGVDPNIPPDEIAFGQKRDWTGQGLKADHPENFQNGRIENMASFQDGTVDVFISIGLLNPEHVEKISGNGQEQGFYEAAAKEIRRVLKQDGIALISTGPSRESDIEQIFRRDLEGSGKALYLLSSSVGAYAIAPVDVGVADKDSDMDETVRTSFSDKNTLVDLISRFNDCYQMLSKISRSEMVWDQKEGPARIGALLDRLNAMRKESWFLNALAVSLLQPNQTKDGKTTRFFLNQRLGMLPMQFMVNPTLAVQWLPEQIKELSLIVDFLGGMLSKKEILLRKTVRGSFVITEKDAAASTEGRPVSGGIDMNSGRLDLREQNLGSEAPVFQFNRAFPNSRNVAGYRPVIMSIQPLTDLRAYFNGN